MSARQCLSALALALLIPARAATGTAGPIPVVASPANGPDLGERSLGIATNLVGVGRTVAQLRQIRGGYRIGA